jgi:hypothetical protein
MGFPNGTLRRLEFANKAIADELPVLHSLSAIIGDPETLLRVISRHQAIGLERPLYPRKQTFVSAIAMSALGQKATSLLLRRLIRTGNLRSIIS